MLKCSCYVMAILFHFKAIKNMTVTKFSDEKQPFSNITPMIKYWVHVEKRLWSTHFWGMKLTYKMKYTCVLLQQFCYNTVAPYLKMQEGTFRICSFVLVHFKNTTKHTINLQNLRFSWCWIWRVLSFGMSHHVVWQKWIHILEKILSPSSGLKNKTAKQAKLAE